MKLSSVAAIWLTGAMAPMALAIEIDWNSEGASTKHTPRLSSSGLDKPLVPAGTS
jgi:hypothetical protein